MSTPTSTLPPVLFPLPSGPLSEVIAEVLRPGLQALHLQDPEGHGLLAAWAEPILERMAWKAWTKGLEPDGDVGSAEPLVEAELKRQSKPGAPAGPAGRRQLMALLATVDRLLWKAGWFASAPLQSLVGLVESPQLRFSCTWLPSLLVGKRIWTEPSEATELRAAFGANPSWALAGWAAVRHGDSAELWIDLFLQETDPVQWLARVVPTACVLAAVEPGMVPEAKFLLAYQECVRGLCWFPPRHMEDDYDSYAGNEPATGWQLPRTPWLQAVMALAGLPEVQQSWTAALLAGFWQPPPDLLAPLVSLLGLAGPDARPKAPVPKHVAGLLLPQRALVEDLWDPTFWQQMNNLPRSPGLVNALNGPRSLSGSMTVRWQEKVCLPALLKARSSWSQARRLLALPAERGPWGVLLYHSNLVHHWVEIFHSLLKPGAMGPMAEPKEICDAWARVMSMAANHAQYRYGSAVDAVDAQLQAPIAWLKASGLWSMAQESLRQELIRQPPCYVREEAPVGFAAALRLFQLAALTEEDWTQLLTATRHIGPEYDSLYVEAGAPRTLLVSRLLGKLQLALQDGQHPPYAEQHIRDLLGDVMQPMEVVEAVLGAMTEIPDQRLARAVARWPDGPWLKRLLALQGSALHDKVQPWLMPLAKFAQDVGVRRQAALALMKQQALASGGNS